MTAKATVLLAATTAKAVLTVLKTALFVQEQTETSKLRIALVQTATTTMVKAQTAKCVIQSVKLVKTQPITA